MKSSEQTVIRNSRDNKLSNTVGKPWFWGAVLACLYGVYLLNGLRFSLPEPLPKITKIDEFQLLDQYGQAFGSEQLRGKIWVANFIFTRCPTVCPVFTQRMRKIQNRTRGLSTAFHLVSFSVDPEHDTPERLRAYAQAHGASRTLWRFLTGPLDSVKSVVTDGLKASMGNDAPEGNFEGIFHGSHFVLVDRNMTIRGFYDANDADSIDSVVQAAGLLMNRGS